MHFIKTINSPCNSLLRQIELFLLILFIIGYYEIVFYIF